MTGGPSTLTFHVSNGDFREQFGQLLRIILVIALARWIYRCWRQIQLRHQLYGAI